ncbi:hypothetical protein B0H16DRAFT_1661761 [Mycena metata]|uniref:DUF6570 domain-containing protein n=1 Tax=Mycena metata TaxID=1033252 RepID=A0AAD7JER5_9AGAR|nr:hypothetical protein B0H16DRAFT_1661761 [Mycena metata]
MIALCRAKCWIVQLREDNAESSVPIAQRGVKGHIIVYPQKPSSIAQSLPPSLEDIITPVCVIFATPLIVRKERVLKALEWLKVHNHLYAKIPINRSILDALPDESVLPFRIQHILPSAGIDVTTSDYIPGSSSPPIPFQSVVVTDVDGNAPSADLRAAALRHMNKPGGNYLELPHDKDPANEFNNPNLFPMMYPTLFPYGIGGMEDKNRRSKLGFKRHIKHLLVPFPLQLSTSCLSAFHPEKPLSRTLPKSVEYSAL